MEYPPAAINTEDNVNRKKSKSATEIKFSDIERITKYLVR